VRITQFTVEQLSSGQLCLKAAACQRVPLPPSYQVLHDTAMTTTSAAADAAGAPCCAGSC
jgi:hypothetical protein